MIALVIAAMVVLDCTADECTRGVGGRRYQTGDLEEANAIRMLEFHLRNHEPGRQEQVSADVVARVKPETVPRPKLSKRTSTCIFFNSGRDIKGVSCQEFDMRR